MSESEFKKREAAEMRFGQVELVMRRRTTGLPVRFALVPLVVLLSSLTVASSPPAGAASTTMPLQFGAPTGYSCNFIEFEYVAHNGSVTQIENNVPFDSWNGKPYTLKSQAPEPLRSEETTPGPNCGDTAHGSSASFGSFATAATTFADTASTMAMTSTLRVGGRALPYYFGLPSIYETAWVGTTDQTMNALVDPALTATSETVAVTVNYTQNDPSQYGTGFYISDEVASRGSFGCTAPGALSRQYSGAEYGGLDPGAYDFTVTYSCPAGDPIIYRNGVGPTLTTSMFQTMGVHNGQSATTRGSFTINSITATVS